MKNEKDAIRIARLIYLTVISALLFVLSLGLVLSCIRINSSGNNPFSYESIGSAFSEISVLFFFTVILAIAGGVFFGLVYKKPEAKRRAQRNTKLQLEKAYVSRDSSESPELLKLIHRQQWTRIILGAVNLCLYVILGLIAFFIAIDKSAYSMQLNESVLGVTLRISSLLAAPVALSLFRVFFDEYSRKKELSYFEKLPRAEADSAAERAGRSLWLEKNRNKLLCVTRVAFLALSALFIVLGILNGGMSDVLEKAVKICTECIGLG